MNFQRELVYHSDPLNLTALEEDSVQKALATRELHKIEELGF